MPRPSSSFISPLSKLARAAHSATGAFEAEVQAMGREPDCHRLNGDVVPLSL